MQTQLKEYRLTKYNPDYRVNGVYKKEDWTSVCDTGKSYNGEILTKEVVDATIDNYTNCILDILKESQIAGLTITELESYDNALIHCNDHLTKFDEIGHVINDCLREKYWCKLEGEQGFVHFGYDLYVYIACSLDINRVSEIAGIYNLYIEEMKSPYNKIY